MTIYETIKAAISVKQAAEHYGLKVSHNGMACCPFHNDRHPSLKLNEDYFFCFGCGAKGDVIDLVARLFNLSSYEAAQKLASDFGLDPKPPTAAAMAKPKRPYIRQFREDEMLCFRVLTDYLHLLEDWKVRYAPKTPDDALDDRLPESFCTCRLSRKLVKGLPNYKLNTLCDHFGIALNHHEALSDARGAAKIMIELSKLSLF